VCISLGLEHVLWPLCGCGHLCLLVVLSCVCFEVGMDRIMVGM